MPNRPTIAIANPAAGGGKVARRWSALQERLAPHVGDGGIWRTECRGDAIRLGSMARREGVGRIIVCGGDGTLNEVVNGLLATDAGTAPMPELLIYDHGTGGDFVRMLPCRGSDFENVLRHSVRRPVDVGRVTVGDGTVRHFINVSSFGVSGLIAEQINATGKLLGGMASFYLGTLKGLIGWRNRAIRLTAPGFEETLDITAVAVANARYFAGGMQIAPGAELADGMLDVVIIKDAGAGIFLRHAPSLYRGTHLRLPWFETFRTPWLEAHVVDEGPLVGVETDGEVVGKLSARYDILPTALTVRTLG